MDSSIPAAAIAAANCTSRFRRRAIVPTAKMITSGIPT